jgi:hypothetical protein
MPQEMNASRIAPARDPHGLQVHFNGRFSPFKGALQPIWTDALPALLGPLRGRLGHHREDFAALD